MPNIPALAQSEPSDCLPTEAAEIVRAYQRASKADATVRAYTSDARVFQDWCLRYGFRPLPASPEVVAGFLAAIRYAHKLDKVPDPTDDKDVRAATRGIRRRVGTVPVQKAAAAAETLIANCDWTIFPSASQARSAINLTSVARLSEGLPLLGLRIPSIEASSSFAAHYRAQYSGADVVAVVASEFC